MDFTQRDLIADMVSDLNTLTTIAKASVIVQEVNALAIGETRPAAVLFLDIVNFTDLTNKLPTERLSMLIDRIFQIFELSVKAYGGYCDKVIGDAGLYVFPGHPAHPPAIEGALRAALTIRERAEQLRESLESLNINFAVRQGVAFGEVTRERIGGETQQFTVMGQTVNIAQRLQSSAEPNEINVLPEIAENMSTLFTFESIGIKELKGVGSFEVFKLIKLNRRLHHFRSSGTYLSKFVGRDKEFNQAISIIDKWLTTTYDESTLDVTKMTKRIKNRNKMLVIRGEMAMGKSRMAHEIRQYYINKLQANTTVAYCLLNNILDFFAAELISIANIDAQNLLSRWEELCSYAEEKISKSYADRQRRHLPLLAMLVNCPDVDTSMIKKIDLKSFMRAVQLAFCAACEMVSLITNKPVIITIEDLQWIGSFEEMLAKILEMASLKNPLIIIGTARPEYKHNTALFNDVCEYEEIFIDTISPEAGRELVNSILPNVNFGVVLWEQLHAKADGIPYYYEEFAKMLVNRGYVAEVDGSFQLIREITSIDLPADIQMLILGKLDQLEPELKLLVSKASVLGRVFLARLLYEIESNLVNGTPEKLPEMLDRLVAEDILVRSKSVVATSLPDNISVYNQSNAINFAYYYDKFFFKHIVTQESAYRAILERNKWLLHSLAAKILERMIVPGSKDEKELLKNLVSHLEFLEKYLEAHKRCCQLLRLLANTGNYSGWEFWEQKAYYTWLEAREKDPSLPIDSPWFLEEGLGRKLLRTGKYNMAIECYTKASLIFNEIGDLQDQGSVLHSIGNAHFILGRYENAMDYYKQALFFFEKINHKQGEALTLHSIGAVYMYAGQYEEAMKFYEESLSIKKEIGDLYGLGTTIHNIGVLYYNQGNYEKALENFQSSLLIRQEVGDRFGEGITLQYIGNVFKEKSLFDKAMDYYQKALDITREVGDLQNESIILNSIGVMFRNTGDFELAIKYLKNSLRIKRSLDDQLTEALVLKLIGDIYKEKELFELAISNYQKSLDIERENGNKYIIASILMDLALLYQQQGFYNKALETVEEALMINSEIGNNFGELTAIEIKIQLLLLLNQKESIEELKQKMTQLSAVLDNTLNYAYYNVDWAIKLAIEGNFVLANNYLQKTKEMMSSLEPNMTIELAKLIKVAESLVNAASIVN